MALVAIKQKMALVTSFRKPFVSPRTALQTRPCIAICRPTARLIDRKATAAAARQTAASASAAAGHVDAAAAAAAPPQHEKSKPQKQQPQSPSPPRDNQQVGVLLVQCPDAKGVVASLAQVLFGFNANIVESDQFTDETTSPPRFFQRITFDYSELSVGAGNASVLERAVAELAARYGMEYRFSYRPVPKRVAVLVSKMDHCLWDLCIRHQSNELKCSIPVIVSNWPDLAHVAKTFGVDFVHLPIDPAKGGKAAQEARIEAVLADAKADVVVLARYMQIMSENFCARNAHRTINIHHSFLPAFDGARPYHRAHERGVKLIGATAHYATSELDAGPIIAQDVVHISHRDAPADLVRKGKDLERLVLARAVRWHLADRVLVSGNRTVVFED